MDWVMWSKFKYIYFWRLMDIRKFTFFCRSSHAFLGFRACWQAAGDVGTSCSAHKSAHSSFRVCRISCIYTSMLPKFLHDFKLTKCWDTAITKIVLWVQIPSLVSWILPVFLGLYKLAPAGTSTRKKTVGLLMLLCTFIEQYPRSFMLNKLNISPISNYRTWPPTA